MYHFALFLVQRDELTGEVTILRKLQDYESPYISQKSFVNGKASCKLVLRKSSWDSKIGTYESQTNYHYSQRSGVKFLTNTLLPFVSDDELLNHKVTLNMIYLQTLSDLERGWIQANPEVRRQLAQMQSRGAKREYMEMAKSLKDYGYFHFKSCICDYPMTNTM